MGKLSGYSPRGKARGVNAEKEVTVKHNWVYAGTFWSGDQKCLVVYRSIRTERNRSSIRPVTSYLGVYCHTMPTPAEVVDDVTMMGGKAIKEFYLVYDECPGALDHRCAAAELTVIISA